jgi:hypothetical protein
MPSIESTSIDCPTRYAATVVNLLQRDARGHHNVFHLGSVLNSSLRIGVKRLDEDAATSACQSGKHESSRIISHSAIQPRYRRHGIAVTHKALQFPVRPDSQ